LKDNTRAKINKGTFEVLPIFKMIQNLGNISETDMFNTYNMGVGLMFVVSKEDAATAVKVMTDMGEVASVIGEIIEGEKGVDIC
ncbi:MAG: AIR synthase-related protein, partial [Oscillospiraceae bacterium]